MTKKGGAGLLRRALVLNIATIGWNVVEAAVALVAGFLAGSIALKGFGFDSLIEVASACFIYWKLRLPAGRDGTREAERRERVALRGIGITFLVLAAYIGWEAADDIAGRAAPGTSPAGIVLAALSLVVMPALGLAKMRTGRAMGSRAVQADAMETLVCGYLSLTLLAGLLLNALLGWWWADAGGGLLMIPFLLWQAREAIEDAEGA